MILWRAGFRYLIHHPLQIVFAVIGVALESLSLLLSISPIAAQKRAFSLSADALVGRTTHMVVGRPSGLPEDSYSDLRLKGHWRNSAPVVEGYASVASHSGLILKLVGVDPFAESPFWEDLYAKH